MPVANQMPMKTAAAPKISREVTASPIITALKATPKSGTAKLKNVSGPGAWCRSRWAQIVNPNPPTMTPW